MNHFVSKFICVVPILPTSEASTEKEFWGDINETDGLGIASNPLWVWGSVPTAISISRSMPPI